MRPAAELLLIEASALRPILEGLELEQFDEPTVCTGWSVRDVLGYCGAALTRVIADDLHEFSPADNEADVEQRRPWPVKEVLDHQTRCADGGETSERNLAPACRHDNLVKERHGWRCQRLPNGDHQWTSQLGHTYTTSGLPP